MAEKYAVLKYYTCKLIDRVVFLRLTINFDWAPLYFVYMMPAHSALKMLP